MTPIVPIYVPARASHSEFLDVRGLRYHVRVWSPETAVAGGSTTSVDAASVTAPAARPTVMLLHGWMDISASFQFVVDALPRHWRILAPDWRGYGLTQWPAADCYWFPDYLADLDALVRHFCADDACDLVGHSMGGNIATLYAGIRPERVRRLINLEGMGLPPGPADEAPDRYRQWLDEILQGQTMRDYPSLEAVAQRLIQNNPRLRPDLAAFVARFWSAPNAAGRYEVLGDPAHKTVNPVLYRVEEVTAVWRRIQAPVAWVISQGNPRARAMMDDPAYRHRLAAIASLKTLEVANAGHMMHHDQPGQLARLIEGFLS